MMSNNSWTRGSLAKHEAVMIVLITQANSSASGKFDIGSLASVSSRPQHG